MDENGKAISSAIVMVAGAVLIAGGIVGNMEGPQVLVILLGCGIGVKGFVGWNSISFKTAESNENNDPPV